MKQKQFFFALVAMLSFVFSGFAQTTVSSEDELRAALTKSTGGEITLAEDVTLKENIETGNGNYTLNLNNHQIKGDFSGYVLKVGGTLTIKGDGEITGKTTILYCKSGGTINIEGGAIHNNSNNNVIFTVGTLNVYGGSILSTASPNRAIEGAGSGKINLYGGTVTSLVVAKGALNIAGINVTVENGINVGKNAGNVNISAGTIKGDVTIADEAKSKVTISGGSFEDTDAIKDYLPSGSALLQKPDGTYEIVAGLLKIGDTYYPTLDAAFKAAADGATIELINQEGAVIAMNGSLYGKNVTITGTAKVDWNKGFLFVGRGGEGNATLTFDNANLTSASNSSSYGIHVSGREKDTNNKYDGTLVIKNSTIELDYLINKGAMTLDNSTLTVKNGFDLNGRPAKETENGEDANATLALANNSKLVVNNHNGMGIGREGKGELTVDASSTFEHTQDFIVSANGTMDVKGTLVSNGKKLTNNGEVKFTATKLTAATIEGTGTTHFYNDVNFYGANSITTGINGTPFHLVINEGANLFITRFVLGYDRNITVNGTIADASAFNPAGQTPSLKFNSTSGVSVGGTGTGNLTVKNAYVELGSSSWKSAQGTYDWDFVNSYVSAVSFTNATGADAATWDVTFDKSVLDAKNYIKNGKNVTYNFTNNSRGTTGSLRIDGVLYIDATSSVVTTSQQNNKVGAVDEHGGINGTVNVEGNLTIGSNAKTQLEVLGGTVNVVNGATLALGNNTMTLDAASALQSAGNISGAITAANGANVAITGGTYTQDVSNWCADGFMTQQNADGSFGIAKAAAKVGDKKYASLEEAFKAATSGCTIEIVSDVTVDYNWDARYTGGKFTVPVTINGNGKTIKFTASVNDNNYQAPFRFEADATVKNLIVDMSEVTDNRFRAISSKGNLTVDGCKFIGKDESLNCRAIIFGEGAGANVGNLAVAITNSEFINWRRGITDNENAQDVKTVTITGNTLTDAGVGVSAKEKVTFTGNTVAGAYVNIKSYTAGNKLAVTATGNTLEANTDDAYNVIDAGGVVNAEGFNIVAKGNNFNGYTSTDGIWGDVWGNARESFVIKVLDANGNVMGTTSLNNIGGIINGNVNVTWNLKLDAASNTDEYWTMSWTTTPTINNMPAKVELWVDGVKVSGGNVVLNGPDDLNKIVAAVADESGVIKSFATSLTSAVAGAQGKTVVLLRDSNEEILLPNDVTLNANGFNAPNVKKTAAAVNGVGYASLADAMAVVKAGETVTVYAGTYAMPSMKAGITIVGEGEVMFEGTLTGTLEDLTMKNIHIKGGNAQRWAYAKGDLWFENVTFEATSVYALHFDGITAGTNLTYKNCTIIGWAAMGGSPKSCVFEGCTIKGNGTYGVIRTYFDATIKDCTFDVANVNTTDAYEDGIHAVEGAKVVVTNCTNAKGEMKDIVNVHASSVVTVDGTVYKNVAKVVNNYYATLAEAFTAVGDGAGKTVELIADVDLAGAEWTPVTFNGVFDGQNHTISNLVVNGAGKSNQGFFAQTQNGEIKNVTFNNAKVTGRLNVGVVAGTPYTSKYTNVKVTGHVEVNGMAYVGGVGGKNAYANWTDITVDVDETSYVKATSTENGTAYRTYVGGVIGFNGEGNHTFQNISSNIKVIGDVMDIGGIFGILHYGNNAENITFTGAVEAPAEAKEVGGIAGVWHNQKDQTVTITNAKSEGTVKVGDDTTTGSIVGGAYNAANQSPATSGSLMIDGKEAWAGLAKIDNTYYATLQAAISEAKAGETITLLADIESSDIITINKSIALDGNGKKLTSTAGRAINVSGADGVTIKNLTINTNGERAINVIQNATNVTIDNVTATAKNYTVNVAASAPNAVVAINNSTLNGLCTVNVSAAGANVTVDNSTVNCNDNNTTAGESYAALSLNKEAVGGSIVATESTINVTDGSDSMKGRNGAENGTVTINGSTDGVAVMVAKIEYAGSTYYHSFATIDAAIAYAKAGDVVTLIRDVTTSAQININKNVTIDGCDKKLTVNAARGFQITGGTVAISNMTIDMPNAAEGNRGINLYNGDTNAALDVTLNNVTINGGKAYAVNIGGGKDNKLTINGSTLTGYAAINVHTSSVNHTIVVDGSTLNGKNHNNNYSFGTVVVDGTNAHSLTITNTTITTENLEGVTSKYEKVVVGANCTLNWDGGEAAVRSILADSKGGKLYYTDLQTAINDAAEVSGTVQILGNITATKSIAIPAAKKVTIDLNGKTITGTDNETKSYGLININTGAELTINDATGNGAIKLTATTNREWNAYSSVISNQRGKLTVNGGTIEHLGGTAMAYAIDNLTNGKGTYAETIINGGTIKSTYRAIRQFLNGTEAQNILTVNGGTIEGTNKSIWMQEASANANNGALTVAAAAAIKGDVYLSANASAKEWPVTVAVAAAALQGESKVLTSNVPVGYELANVDGIYRIYTGVAKIGTAYYTSIQDAVEAAQNGETIKLTQNVTIDELVKLEKAITLDLNYKKVTSTAMKAFEVYAKATIKNGTIEAVQRCVDTRKAVELTLKDVTLNADKYTSYGNPQPLTIGGYEKGTKVTMTNVNINAADGYGIITFVKTELTATNSTIAGYSALYVKPGSDNSVFNFTESALSGSNAGNDVEGNSFSTIAVRANNVTVNVDAASTVTAVGNYCDAMSFGGNYAGEESVTDANVTIAGTINGNIMFAGLALNNNVISVKAEYADELATAGFVTSEADATGLVTIKDVTVLNEMTIEHSAYAGLEFVNENEKEVGTLKYVRNFDNTNWRALYVPFAINYDDIKDDFEVRRLEMAHEIEKTDGSVEIKFDFMTIKDGQTLKANYPYLIKPKKAGVDTITVKNTTLKKTVSRSIDCSTVDHKFIFTGIYETVSGQEMVVNKYYAMNANQLQYATDPDYHALNPFNWYMKIEGREDLSDVKFVFGGDFEDEETTGITNIDNDQKNDDNIYDLQGRRVLHPQKGSLYIVNGKKVVY